LQQEPEAIAERLFSLQPLSNVAKVSTCIGVEFIQVQWGLAVCSEYEFILEQHHHQDTDILGSFARG
jgi:hypothetical protein